MKDSINKGVAPKATLVVITTSFPNKLSTGGNFILELCKKLTKHFDITILAPLVENALKEETIGDIKIIRHPVSPFGNRGLCQGSGIVSNFKKSPWLILFVPFLLFNQIFWLIKICNKVKPKTIHAHWIISSGLAAVLYKRFFNKNIRVLLTSHGSDLNKFNLFPITLIKKFVMNNCDTFSAVSSALKEKAKLLGCKKEIHVVPMGVDTTLFFPTKTPKITHNQINVLLFVGSIIEGKGIRTLIGAVRALMDSGKRISLIIVGTGNLEPEMRNLVSELDMDDSVHFAGMLENSMLPQIYREADMLVLPSHSEGFPVVIVEALSSGLPCVTSDIPVFTNMANDNEFIFTSKTGDVNDLERAITKVLETDGETLQNIHKNARAYAVNNLSWESTVNKIIYLINETSNS